MQHIQDNYDDYAAQERARIDALTPVYLYAPLADIPHNSIKGGLLPHSTIWCVTPEVQEVPTEGAPENVPVQQAVRRTATGNIPVIQYRNPPRDIANALLGTYSNVGLTELHSMRGVSYGEFAKPGHNWTKAVLDGANTYTAIVDRVAVLREAKEDILRNVGEEILAAANTAKAKCEDELRELYGSWEGDRNRRRRYDARTRRMLEFSGFPNFEQYRTLNAAQLAPAPAATTPQVVVNIDSEALATSLAAKLTPKGKAARTAEATA